MVTTADPNPVIPPLSNRQPNKLFKVLLTRLTFKDKTTSEWKEKLHHRPKSQHSLTLHMCLLLVNKTQQIQHYRFHPEGAVINQEYTNGWKK